MKKSIFVFLMLCGFIVTGPKNSHALSCMAPAVDEKTIEATDLVFEGRAEVEKLWSQDRQDAEHTAVYLFKIEKLWKGTVQDTVEIKRNIYWGDMFALGEKYLIFANKENGIYETELCGPSGSTDNPRIEEYKSRLKDILEH